LRSDERYLSSTEEMLSHHRNPSPGAAGNLIAVCSLLISPIGIGCKRMVSGGYEDVEVASLCEMGFELFVLA
jgi:hypothetical protein